MNNIAIYLFCLLIMSPSSYAEYSLSDACGEFRYVLSDSAQNVRQNKSIGFKKGLLWKIETSQGKINYLFGTMHSQDIAVSTIPEPVRKALIESKLLLMETIPNQSANEAFLNMMAFQEGQQLDHLLELVIFNELSRQIQDYGVTKEQVKSMKPWAVFSLIGRPKPIRAPTLEDNLLQLAQQHRLNVKSLETMTEILSSLDSLAIDDQLTILKDTVCNHEQIIRDTRDLVNIYLNRDLAALAAFNDQTHYDEGVFERFMQRILYDRNSRMINRIAKEFTTGNVFAAVGASHLIEEKGLLNQLHIKGYRLTLVY